MTLLAFKSSNLKQLKFYNGNIYLTKKCHKIDLKVNGIMLRNKNFEKHKNLCSFYFYIFVYSLKYATTYIHAFLYTKAVL